MTAHLYATIHARFPLHLYGPFLADISVSLKPGSHARVHWHAKQEDRIIGTPRLVEGLGFDQLASSVTGSSFAPI